MCPGVPVRDCAIIWPRVSKTPQARSCDSRTTVLKAVRISAACCSLATERSRFQRISRVTGSSACCAVIPLCRVGVVSTDMRLLDLHDQIPLGIDRHRRTWANDCSRLTFLDDGRPQEGGSGPQAVAIVDRHLLQATL